MITGDAMEIILNYYVLMFCLYYFVMGNSSGNASKAKYKDFQMQKYMNQGLNQNQIIQIKEAFDYCEPEDGRIKLNKLKIATENSQAKQKIETYMRNRDTMDFDEFFGMSK